MYLKINNHLILDPYMNKIKVYIPWKQNHHLNLIQVKVNKTILKFIKKLII